MGYRSRTISDVSHYIQTSKHSEWDWVEQERIRASDAKLDRGLARLAITRGIPKRPGMLLENHPGVGQTTPRRVLVVGDGDGLCELVVGYLRTAGVNLQVAAAHDGYDAVCQVTSFEPDLVIVDLITPNMNGFQFCRRLKRDPESEHIKILVVTDNPTSVNVAMICEAQADGVAWKPLHPEALRDTAYALLGMKGARSLRARSASFSPRRLLRRVTSALRKPDESHVPAG